MEKLTNTIFYTIEKTIKTYRQFAQRNINDQFNDITIDQWLILNTLHESPDISQMDLAKAVFKDYASITRIIEKLVENKYLSRRPHPYDGRRFKLDLTAHAKNKFDALKAVVKSNRAVALEEVSDSEIKQIHKILEKIYSNCQLKSNTYEPKTIFNS